jgi:hypothetical protein
MLEKHRNSKFKIKDEIKKMIGGRTYDLVKFDQNEKIYIDNYWNLRIPIRFDELVKNV